MSYFKLQKLEFRQLIDDKITKIPLKLKTLPKYLRKLKKYQKYLLNLKNNQNTPKTFKMTKIPPKLKNDKNTS